MPIHHRILEEQCQNPSVLPNSIRIHPSHLCPLRGVFSPINVHISQKIYKKDAVASEYRIFLPRILLAFCCVALARPRAKKKFFSFFLFSLFSLSCLYSLYSIVVARWLLVGCLLVARWLLVGCQLVAYWLLVGCQLVAGWLLRCAEGVKIIGVPVVFPGLPVGCILVRCRSLMGALLIAYGCVSGWILSVSGEKSVLPGRGTRLSLYAMRTAHLTHHLCVLCAGLPKLTKIVYYIDG